MWRFLITVSLMTGLIVPMTIAELTKEDIREIEAIVQKSENRLQSQLREYIDLRFTAQDAKIDGKFARVDEQFANVDKQFAMVDKQFVELDKRLEIVYGFVIGLLILIVVAVGIPQIIIAHQTNRSGGWKKEIDPLKHEIETLKRNRVAKS